MQNEFEIENARSQIDKNVSVINNEFEVVSEGYKMEVSALNVPLVQYKIFNFEDLFKNRHIFKSGSSIKETSEEYMSLHLNATFKRNHVHSLFLIERQFP